MDPKHAKQLRTTASSRGAKASIGEQPDAHLVINGAASAAPRFKIQAVAPRDRISGRTGSGGPLAGS